MAGAEHEEGPAEERGEAETRHDQEGLQEDGAETELEHDPERLQEDPEPYPAKAPAGELELSDEQLERQAAAKQAAGESLDDGDLQKAMDSFTEAIMIGNASAILYAKRADVLLRLERPCACISDCNAAVEINPDSAKAYSIRGKAQRRLGNWEQAYKDLSLSQQLDYDDDLVEMHTFVGEKCGKIRKPVIQEQAPVTSSAGIVEEESESEEFDEEEDGEGGPDNGLPVDEDPETYPAKGPDDELTVMANRRQQDVIKRATKAMQKGCLRKAYELFTEAINMGNPSTALYAKRADILLRLGRPNACLSDCGFALEINPDSVKLLRVRGKAYVELERWEDAQKDITLSQQLDFDDDMIDVERLVAAEVNKILKQQSDKRIREEQCVEENMLRRRRAHEERKKAEAEAEAAAAREKAERSLSRRCQRCCRRRPKSKADEDEAEAAAEGEPEGATVGSDSGRTEDGPTEVVD